MDLISILHLVNALNPDFSPAVSILSTFSFPSNPGNVSWGLFREIQESPHALFSPQEERPKEGVGWAVGVREDGGALGLPKSEKCNPNHQFKKSSFEIGRGRRMVGGLPQSNPASRFPSPPPPTC